MAILLCSRNETVLKKWCAALNEKWQTHQAMSVKELHTIIERFQVDVIMLHRSMIDEEQLHDICDMGRSGLKVFVFSDRPNDQEGIACLQLGCVGYANTYIRTSRLVTAIEAVESGLVWVGTSLMQHLIRGLNQNAEHTKSEEDDSENSLLSKLSKREYQIAKLVADGLQNNEIATELAIAERTVKAHLSSIYFKTHTKGRLNLALLVNTE